MHSFYDKDRDVSINYNSDFSGDAILNFPVNAIDADEVVVTDGEYYTVRVPAMSIKQLGINAAHSSLISYVESWDGSND